MSASGSLLQKTEMADKQRSYHSAFPTDTWLKEGTEPNPYRNMKKVTPCCYRLTSHFFAMLHLFLMF